MAKEPKPPLKAMPTKEFIYPYFLLILHELGGSARNKDVINKLAKRFKLSDELIKEVTTKGNPQFPSRVGWTEFNLRFIGYLKYSPGDIWVLSQQGKEMIPNLTKWLSNRDKESLDNFREEVSRLLSEEQDRRKSRQKDSVEAMVNGEEADREGEQAKKERREQEEQLEKIRSMDPFAFERLCKKLFDAVGYEDAVETKRSHDGGIDGYGFLTFGLVRFKVVFQAKRWKEGTNINLDHIVDLAVRKRQVKGVKAEKAVLITTSDFTKDARKRADELGIECINGNRLVGLLKKYKLGYSPVTEHEFDKDFFDKV